MTDLTDPLVWVNNVNTTVQRGPDGTLHNLSFLDGDWDNVIGPTDPRMSNIHSVPVDIYRPHIHIPFDAPTIDPRCVVSTWGSGSYSLSQSNLILQTGDTINSGVEITLPNVAFPFVPGSLAFFYLETTPNGNLDVQFGIRSISGAEYARFRRIDTGTAGYYNAEVAHGGAGASDVTVLQGDSTRRPFLIYYSSSQIDFYTSNTGGNLLYITSIATNLPTGFGVPFMRISNTYAANRTLKIDDIYLMPIK